MSNSRLARRFALWLLFALVGSAALQPKAAFADTLATGFTVSVNPTTVTAGGQVTATVTAVITPPVGPTTTDTGYTGTVQISSSDPAATFAPSSGMLTNGVGNFSVTLKTVGTGTQTVTASGPGATGTVTGTSGGITVNPAVAKSFSVSAPGSVTAGNALSPTAKALDMYGNVATSYNGTATITSTDTQIGLPSPPTVTFTNGVAAPFSVTLKSAGNRTITLADGSITGTSGNISVSAAGTSGIAFSSVPTSATAGTPFGVTVKGSDPFGNPTSGDTVTLSSSDTATFVPSSATLTGGAASFSAVTLKTVGSQTLTAHDGGLSTTAMITVTAGGPATLTLSAPSNATAGTAFNVTVTAKDGEGNVATGYTGPVRFSGGGPNAVLPGNSMLTSGAGTFSVTLKAAGGQTITVADAGSSTPTPGSAMVTVTAASATQLAVSVPPTPPSLTAGTAFPVTVTAQDPFGNTDPTFGGTVQLSSSTDASATFSAAHTLSAGVGTFQATFGKSGSQSITAQDTVNQGIQGTKNNIIIVAGAATKLVFVSVPVNTTAGSPFQVTVQAQDANGNVAGTSPTVHFSVASGMANLPPDSPLSNGQGTFSVTLDTAPSQTLTVSSTGLASAAATITVGAGGISRFSVVPPSTPQVAGQPFTVNVTALDAGGNTVTAYNGTAQITSDDPQATVGGSLLPSALSFTSGTASFSITLQTSGTKHITVTDSSLNPSVTGSAPVIITAAAASTLTLSAPASATAGAPFSVTATARDQFGNVATGYAGTVHFSSTDGQAVLPANYVFTGGDGGVHTFTNGVTLLVAGPQTITVADTSGTGPTAGSANVTVGAGGATHFSVSAPTPETAGSAFSVTVTALDAAGNVATGYAGTVHFSSTDGQAVLPADGTLTGGVGTFTVTLSTAGAQTVTATDTVTSSITGTSGSITVVSATAVSLVLAIPSQTTVGAPFTLSVTAKDQFGNVATGYTGTVHFSGGGAGAVLPADYTFTASDHGTHTFTGGGKLFTAGVQSVSVSDNGSPPLTSQQSITVNQDSTSIQLQTSNSSVPYTTTVTFTATVASTLGDPIDGGQVLFFDASRPAGSQQIGSANVVAETNNGVTTFQALLPTNTLSTGTHPITAQYTGDSNFGASPVSNLVTQTVTTTGPTVAVTSSGSLTAGSAPPTYVSVFNANVTFTVTVTGPGATPTGTVQFQDGGVNLGPPVSLNGGAATLATDSLPVGNSSITAVYSGDVNYSKTVSAPIIEQVNPGSGSVTLTSGNNPAAVGESVRFTATVTGSNGVAPTGSVTFTDTTTGMVLQQNVALVSSGNSGVATTPPLSLPFTGPNGDTVTATYSPDAASSYKANSGTLVQVVDNAAPTVTSLNPSSKFAGEGDFTLTINGTGFVGSPNTPFAGVVQFGSGNPNLGPVNFISQTTLTATVPAADIQRAGTVTVAVTNPVQKPSLPAATTTFSVKSTASSTVTSINPNGIATSSNSFVMAISGKNFQKGATVVFNFTQAGSTTSIATSLPLPNSTDPNYSVTPDLIRLTIPGHDQGENSLLESPGSAIVSVVNADGTISNGQPFTIGVNPAPIVTALTPSSATAGGAAFTLKLTGSDFIPGAQVNFGTAVLAATLDPSDPLNTTLLANVPASLLKTAGAVSVSVSNPSPSTSPSGPLAFQIFNQQPTITGFSPAFLNIPGTVLLNGTTIPAADQPLTIRGTNFAPGASVLFNGTAVPITSMTPTSLLVSLDPSLLTTAALTPVQVINAQTATAAGAGATRTLAVNPVKALVNYPLAAKPAEYIRMFSVPYDYAGSSPYSVLMGVSLSPEIDPTLGYDPQSDILTGVFNFAGQTSLGLALYHWDPVNLDYQTASPPPTVDLQLTLGQSFWAVGSSTSNPFGLMKIGTPAGVTQFPITLTKGWNMIGNPFPKDVTLGSLQVLVNGTVLGFYVSDGNNLGTGVSDGVVSPVLWTWDGTEYQDTYYGKTGSPTTDVLKAYEGYWLYSYTDCSLLVTTQSGNG